MAKREIAVRYCGGCNPRYDRTGAIRRLAELLPGYELAPAQPGRAYPAVAVVCGCPTRCAGIADLNVPPDALVYLTDAQGLDLAAEKLAFLAAGEIGEDKNA